MYNATSIARVGRACLAGFVLVILSASLADADYGPKITIGNNYQQWSNTQSTNGIDAGNCSGTSICIVLFQRAPELKALIVQHVSCYMIVGTGEPQVGRLSTRKGQTTFTRR